MSIKLLEIDTSPKPNKRYMAKFQMPNGRTRTTHFGDPRYQTYIDTHDKFQRDRYWTRHNKDLRTNDATRAGYLSAYLLWGDSSTLLENIRKYKQLFNIG